MADERIRLVTITVTGAGYHLEPATGRFDAEHEDVVADLEHPHAPATFFGLIAEALDRRRAAGTRPFTVLSCDNIPHNGDATRTAVVSFARLRDAGLADWIEAEVAFPNSMVDRITPSTTEDAVELVDAEFGLDDRWPVVTEPFRQWIVEDRFGGERPPLEDVGVQLVDDVEPYELMKKRLLNGSHTALGHLGTLAGHRTTADALADPVFRAFLDHLMADEVVPLLPEVPGIDLGDYRRTLLERFSNPAIKDELARLRRRGSSKIPGYVLPSIADARAAGRPHDLLDLVVAGWVRALRGTDLDGDELPVDDPRAEELTALAAEGGDDPRPLLAREDLFGELSADGPFADSVAAAIADLERDGVHGAIRARLGGAGLEAAA